MPAHRGGGPAGAPAAPAPGVGPGPPPPGGRGDGRLTRIAVATSKAGTDKPLKRGYFQVGQVRFNGEWQPAPKAMTHVLDNIRTYANVDVVLKPDKVDVRDEDIVNYKFLYLQRPVEISCQQDLV